MKHFEICAQYLHIYTLIIEKVRSEEIKLQKKVLKNSSDNILLQKIQFFKECILLTPYIHLEGHISTSRQFSDLTPYRTKRYFM